MKKNLGKMLANIVIVFAICLSVNTVAKAEVAFHELKPAKAENASDVESALMENSAYASGTITRNTKDSGDTVENSSDDYFKFTLPEDGYVYFKYSVIVGDSNNRIQARFVVCGDSGMTNAKANAIDVTDTGNKSQILYLKKGTYFIKCQAMNSFGDAKGSNTVGVTAAYIPIAGKTTDFKVGYSTTKTTTSDVVCKVTTADPDAKVWMKPGVSSTNLIDNQFQWTSEFECQDKSFTITENGKYTVRIATSLGEYYQQVITISNIDNTKPRTPMINSVKAGLKKITGTADAGTLVYIKIGSSTKTAIARDNNSFSMNVSSLKKGAKITAYAVDYAGNKSQSKSYTAK